MKFIWVFATLGLGLIAGLTGCESPNTATRPSIRPDYPPEWQARWMKRHEEFVARAGEGGIEVLFLGDSITDYWRDRGRAVWDRDFAPLHAANFGISGDRTQQVLWRITHGELEGIEPRVVVLMIGTNNTGPGLGENSLTPANTTPEIVAGVRAIVRTIQRKLPATRVLLFGIFPRGETNDPLRKQIAEINAGIARLADGQKVFFRDISADLLGADGSLSKEIMPDLLHPNQQGYEIWSRTLRSSLAQLLN